VLQPEVPDLVDGVEVVGLVPSRKEADDVSRPQQAAGSRARPGHQPHLGPTSPQLVDEGEEDVIPGPEDHPVVAAGHVVGASGSEQREVSTVGSAT
jgi:hypothetical protein